MFLRFLVFSLFLQIPMFPLLAQESETRCRPLFTRILIGTLKAPVKVATFPFRSWKRAGVTIGVLGALTYGAWPRETHEGTYSPIVTGYYFGRDMINSGSSNQIQLDALEEYRDAHPLIPAQSPQGDKK